MRISRITDLAFVSAALVAAEPIVSCAVRYALLSPYDRALRAHDAFCGAALNEAQVFGHCPACYVGVAGLAALTLVWRNLNARLSAKIRAGV